MPTSRRSLLAAALAGGAVPAVAPAAMAAVPFPNALGRRVLNEFNQLPGRKTLKILVQRAGRRPTWSVEQNPDLPLFCASAFKCHVLAEYLRRVEDGAASLSELLPVDDSIWSPGSPVLMPQPPFGGLDGVLQARSALDAMIAYSDNTATDIAMKRLGVDTVRAFIASAGLRDTRIPGSTRSLIAYTAGVPNFATIDWLPLIEVISGPPPPSVPPLINDVETSVSTPNDFVSFYSRALQGAFFQQESSLKTFRHILTLSDTTAYFPLAVTAFTKGGSYNSLHEHALSLAGGVFFPPRTWAYFGCVCNWVDGEGGSAEDEAPKFIRIIRNLFAWVGEAFAS